MLKRCVFAIFVENENFQNFPTICIIRPDAQRNNTLFNFLMLKAYFLNCLRKILKISQYFNKLFFVQMRKKVTHGWLIFFEMSEAVALTLSWLPLRAMTGQCWARSLTQSYLNWIVMSRIFQATLNYYLVLTIHTLIFCFTYLVFFFARIGVLASSINL